MKDNIKTHLKINSDKYLFVLFLFIISITAGVVFVFFMKAETTGYLSEHVRSYLSNIKDSPAIDKAGLLKKSFFKCGIFYLFVFLLSFTKVGQYLPLGAVISEGFSYGFTLAVFVETFGYKGVLFCILAILPQFKIRMFAMAFLFICINSFNRNRNMKKEPEMILAFIFLLIISFLVYSASLVSEYYFAIYFILNLSQTML